MIMPTMKAVTTQLIWSLVAEKLPCIWGRRTAALVMLSS